jgi:hypothetical protein
VGLLRAPLTTHFCMRRRSISSLTGMLCVHDGLFHPRKASPPTRNLPSSPSARAFLLPLILFFVGSTSLPQYRATLQTTRPRHHPSVQQSLMKGIQHSARVFPLYLSAFPPALTMFVATAEAGLLVGEEQATTSTGGRGLGTTSVRCEPFRVRRCRIILSSASRYTRRRHSIPLHRIPGCA